MKEKLTVNVIVQEYNTLKSQVKFYFFFNLLLYLICFACLIVAIVLMMPVTNIIIGVLICLLLIMGLLSVYIIVQETTEKLKKIRKINSRINQLQVGEFTLEKDILKEKILEKGIAKGYLTNSKDVLYLTEKEFNEADSGAIIYRVKFVDAENESVYGSYYFEFEYDVSALLT
ncbi:MAG: hypothetical protein ACI37Z_03475 [Candidatus Gastranaerophilaceae bacterium]